MLTIGLTGGSDNFHWMVPVRVVRKWAKEVKAEWLLDPNGKTTFEALKKLPLENTRAGLSAKKDGKSDTATTAKPTHMDLKTAPTPEPLIAP